MHTEHTCADTHHTQPCSAPRHPPAAIAPPLPQLNLEPDDLLLDELNAFPRGAAGSTGPLHAELARLNARRAHLRMQRALGLMAPTRRGSRRWLEFDETDDPDEEIDEEIDAEIDETAAPPQHESPNRQTVDIVSLLGQLKSAGYVDYLPKVLPRAPAPALPEPPTLPHEGGGPREGQEAHEQEAHEQAGKRRES